MSLNLLMLLALLSFLSSGAIAAVAPPQALRGCMDRCGNVSIPYPFGVKKGCFKDDGYLITCETRKDGILKAYLAGGDTEVLEISLDGKAKFKSALYAYDCFNSTGETTERHSSYWDDRGKPPFWVSATNNKVTAIGCDTQATIDFFGDEDFMTGCISMCSDPGIVSALGGGSCSGIGCCQISFPLWSKGFNVTVKSLYNHTKTSFNVTVKSLYNHTKTSSFNPCSFAFLADKDWYTFRISDLSSHTFERSNIPMVMDWAIGNETCEEAQQNTLSYVCGPNTSCSNSTNGLGYTCYCKDGFGGNPYHPQGCQDINECERGHKNSC